MTAEFLGKARAHYAIESIVDLPAVIDDIDIHLAWGERPSAGQGRTSARPR